MRFTLKKKKNVNCFKLYSLAVRLWYFRFLFNHTYVHQSGRKTYRALYITLIWVMLSGRKQKETQFVGLAANRETISAYPNPQISMVNLSRARVVSYCFFLYVNHPISSCWINKQMKWKLRQFYMPRAPLK